MRAALQLAARGMHVFPLRPRNKRPAVRQDWEGAATLDPDVIRRIWRAAPYNIGIATGPSGLLVVDLDSAREGSTAGRVCDGRRTLAAVARAADTAIPRATFTVATPRGEHLYFRLPQDVRVSSTVGRLGPHVDTRAAGGYVVGPGSVLANGRYRVVASVDPLPVPGWLLARLRHAQGNDASRVVLPTGRDTSAYVSAVVRGEADKVAVALVGQRNQTLFGLQRDSVT
ncbi:bifunctional DNA primase/polymerase [Pseudonocardia lacus]|uniref:bifunctional DNA primase/polymerase n=1 Tax=Pseudonocardia lacus TaxID=2835865 RepID=UPI001BDBDB2F|nr:bifunctional DNA primase/polymerase [Pseudonocardia lacus]